MSLAIVYTRAALGIEAPLITVEVHLSNGLPASNYGRAAGNHRERGPRPGPQRPDQQRLRFSCEEDNH